MDNQIYFKIAGYVDLDMLNMFAVSTYHLSLKRGDEIKKKSSPLKLLSQFQPNFAEMILRWSPFKIVSVSAVLYPRWPPLLPSWIQDGADGHKFERGPHKDHFSKVWLKLAQ
jgi:hypothetical protein